MSYSGCHASASGTVHWYAVDSVATRQMSLPKRKLITVITLFTPSQLSLHLQTAVTDRQTDRRTWHRRVCGLGNKISHCDARRFITALAERSVPTRDKLHSISWTTVVRLRVTLMDLWNVRLPFSSRSTKYAAHHGNVTSRVYNSVDDYKQTARARQRDEWRASPFVILPISAADW